ncbi:uncharacterized protein EI90DRAFT_3131677 [Cantharellus anzutake]|uniref:uncharacterized protein n=1 Tax=Cantharellus anzutake TaxID=1750568 RepID=UPI0019074D71|nr:uncharacterized protein EI90DRAFT_3131677 [Cantharellus anzutake]KAF8321427.1 hypothetical protein EI90DRAFT_3131677 [Cantharellus anzutake]
MPKAPAACAGDSESNVGDMVNPFLPGPKSIYSIAFSWRLWTDDGLFAWLGVQDPQTLQNYKKQLQTAVVLNRQRIFYESQGHNAGSLSTYGQGEQAFSVFSVANTSFPEDLNDLDVDTQSLSDLMNSVGAVDASSSPTTHYSPMPQNLHFTHAPADTYGFYNGQGHPNS